MMDAIKGGLLDKLRLPLDQLKNNEYLDSNRTHINQSMLTGKSDLMGKIRPFQSGNVTTLRRPSLNLRNIHKFPKLLLNCDSDYIKSKAPTSMGGSALQTNQTLETLENDESPSDHEAEDAEVAKASHKS